MNTSPTNENDTILFVVNPKSGGFRSSDLKGLLAKKLKNQPHEIFVSKSAEELKEKLPAKLDNPNLSKVVIAGGDGTIMDLLPFLAERPHLKIGIFPLGTGNLLAQNLGIPIDLKEALKVTLNGRCQPVDLCRINEKYFILNAGVGADAEIMARAQKSKTKQYFGVWTYVVEGAKQLFLPRFAKFHVEADGQHIHARSVGVVCFNAGGKVGRNLTMVPNVLPDDGLLHGCILRVDGLFDFFVGLIQILSGRRGHKRDPVQHFRAKKITITSRPVMRVQADGNVIGKTPVTMEVLPCQLQFLVEPHNH